MPLLKTFSLTKDFGALRVLDDINLEVKEGSLHSVVGPNGAGKTTLFNVISGFLKPTRGRVEFDSKDITYLLANQIALLGIRRSFQIITLFPELTTLENIRLVVQTKLKEKFSFFKKASNFKECTAQSYQILERLGLAEKSKYRARELSHGEQRLLDIGMAMAGESTLLLLDEPTSGLAHGEIARIEEIIRSLAPKQTVMLIEHRIDMVLDISDTITVLNYGHVIGHGRPDVIKDNEEVSRAYLGVR